MRFLLFFLTAFEIACVLYLVHAPSASRCQVLAGEDIQVGCHMERTRSKRSGRTPAEKCLINDCLVQLPSATSWALQATSWEASPGTAQGVCSLSP